MKKEMEGGRNRRRSEVVKKGQAEITQAVTRAPGRRDNKG